MVIFKQNRCIALLVGVILVCFSSISLMNSERVSEGKNTVSMNKLQTTHASAASVLSYPATTGAKRIIETPKPILYTTVADLRLNWNSNPAVNWFTPDKLKPQSAAKKVTIQTKATVVKAPPATAQKALGQAAAKGSQTVKQAKTASQQHPPAKLFFSRTQLLSQEQQAQATWSYAVSDEDLLLLQKIVMAEAEGEPYQGKVAVANVVLNRLRSANFPDTIYKVIYQKSQFSPVANGRLKRVKPNKDSIKAVNAALSGVKEVTDDTYFFLSLKLAQDLTVHHSQEYAKTIGNHTFYK
ncbi:cell wall hydrolase [Paenibacillus sp. FSL L8-0470]|uniref:cell wall hydrolase n=1 Tax=Paenibacillus sp. FSL L8-0470 TaxID=2954688 RepID=UPI0030F8CABE